MVIIIEINNWLLFTITIPMNTIYLIDYHWIKVPHQIGRISSSSNVEFGLKNVVHLVLLPSFILPKTQIVLDSLPYGLYDQQQIYQLNFCYFHQHVLHLLLIHPKEVQPSRFQVWDGCNGHTEFRVNDTHDAENMTSQNLGSL